MSDSQHVYDADDEHADYCSYVIGDVIDYKCNIGTVIRTKILGFIPGFAIQ
jgi:hypothetical protein